MKENIRGPAGKIARFSLTWKAATFCALRKAGLKDGLFKAAVEI